MNSPLWRSFYFVEYDLLKEMIERGIGKKSL